MQVRFLIEATDHARPSGTSESTHVKGWTKVQHAEAVNVTAGNRNTKNPAALKILHIRADQTERLRKRIYKMPSLFYR